MTEMIEVKTNELIGPALDWAAAQVPGALELIVKKAEYDQPFKRDEDGHIYLLREPTDGYTVLFQPSTDWAQGGPLIDEYEICIICLPTCDPIIERLGGGDWSAKTRESDHDYSRLSPTPLVAACRAILRAKFGDIISVPKELMK